MILISEPGPAKSRRIRIPAQLWFDRGLNWTYGFNHEEAVDCFRHAADADPACAMAWWGIAYSQADPTTTDHGSGTRIAEIARQRCLSAHDAVTTAVSLIRLMGRRPRKSVIRSALAKRYRNGEERDTEVLERLALGLCRRDAGHIPGP